MGRSSFCAQPLSPVAAVLGLGHLYAQLVPEEGLYLVAEALALGSGEGVVEVHHRAGDVDHAGVLARGGQLVERVDVSAYPVAQLQRASHEDFLPVVCDRLHPFDADIVYVLYRHQLGVELVEVVDERAVPGGTGEHRAVLLEEGAVVGVDRYGVGVLALVGEAYVVLHAVASFIFVPDFGYRLLEELPVLGGDSYHEVHAPVGIAHVGLSFDEMFGEGGAHLVWVPVELQHSLGLAAVSESLVGEEPAGGRAGVVRGASEGFGGVEREFFQVLRQSAYGIVGRIKACEYVLEHPGCGSRCRNELAFAPYFGGVGILGRLPCLFPVQHFDSLPGSCRGYDVEVGESLPEPFDLCVDL